MTREEAISEWTFRSNHIKKWLDEYGEEPSIRHYVELIDMAISALRQTAWIPVGERLPEYRKTVLISTFWGVRVADRDAVKEDGTDDFWYMFLEDATAHPRYVYAWMPLPEAYKGGDNND